MSPERSFAASYACALLLLAAPLALPLASPLRAQAARFTDDPLTPRTSVSAGRTDLVHRWAAVRQDFDPQSARVRAGMLPIGDVRFGARRTLLHRGWLEFGLEAGVFARFLLDRSSSDLTSSDWYFLVPLTARVPVGAGDRVLGCGADATSLCGLFLTVGARHHSAHGGDDFFAKEGLSWRAYSRDGAILRGALLGPRAGVQFELDHAVRAWGPPAGTNRMVEGWVRPSGALPLRLGALRREIPGSDDPYRAVYASILARVLEVPIDARVRYSLGASPVGPAWGASERTLALELVIPGG